VSPALQNSESPLPRADLRSTPNRTSRSFLRFKQNWKNRLGLGTIATPLKEFPIPRDTPRVIPWLLPFSSMPLSQTQFTALASRYVANPDVPKVAADYFPVHAGQTAYPQP
jgi:hypothetical protein